MYFIQSRYYRSACPRVGLHDTRAVKPALIIINISNFAHFCCSTLHTPPSFNTYNNLLYRYYNSSTRPIRETVCWARPFHIIMSKATTTKGLTCPSGKRTSMQCQGKKKKKSPHVLNLGQAGYLQGYALNMTCQLICNKRSRARPKSVPTPAYLYH